MAERVDEGRRVVVTGVGVTSPIGHSVGESVAAIREGRHGIRYMPEWDIITDMHGRLGATVEGLDLKKHYPRKKRRTMGKVTASAATTPFATTAGVALTESATVSAATAFANSP